MRHLKRFLWVSSLFVVAPLHAEQLVTLKTGTTLVGNALTDGDVVIVQIEDAQLRVPLQNVAAIVAVDSHREQQARVLLVTALEAKLHDGVGTEVVGVLAEAARLSPDDPQIAYWYARSLVDSGFGRAANEIFQRRREAISKAYPGITDELAARIERRLEFEKMPVDLVERIDAINRDAIHRSVDAEMRQLFAVFRITDQHQQSVEQSAFRVQCSGQDEKLESFKEGYYLLMFSRSRHNNDDPCHVEVVQPGLELKRFEFHAASNRVSDAGEFVVRRYDESAKVPFRVRVVGPQSKPVADAQLSLQATSQTAGTVGQPLSMKTDAEGRAEMLLYPLQYHYHVAAQGFSQANGSVEVSAKDDEAKEQQIEINHLIRAKIQVVWVSTDSPSGVKLAGETTLQVNGQTSAPYRPYGPGPGLYGIEATMWIRPIQIHDRMTIQFMETPFGYPGHVGSEAWLRVAQAISEEEDKPDRDDDQAALRRFKELDLDQIEQLKNELSAPEISHQPPQYARGQIVVTAERNNIYVGKLTHRDPRTGQPIPLAFKVLVEELSSDEPPVEVD